MGKYVELPGVKTWYEVEGHPLLLLHGGFCTNETPGSAAAELRRRISRVLPDQRAHEHTPDVAGPLSYHDTAGDTIDFTNSAVATIHGWAGATAASSVCS